MRTKTEEDSVTNIQLGLLVKTYNGNHALKIEVAKNDVSYNTFRIDGKEVGVVPMSNVEAYYFIMGFKFARELVA